MSADVDASDSLMVMLTEVKGDLKSVLRELANLVPRVGQHDLDITDLKLTTQRLTLQAVAREETAVAKAAAVKEADAARVAAAKAEVEKSTRRWTPWERFGATLLTVATTASVLIGAYFLMKGRP